MWEKSKLDNFTQVLIKKVNTSEKLVLLSPGKPPPISRSVILKPSPVPKSKRSLAREIALRKAAGSRHPEPTWKLTPTTFNPRSRARVNRLGPSVTGSHPYLIPSWEQEDEASQRIRSTKLKWKKTWVNKGLKGMTHKTKERFHSIYSTNSLAGWVEALHFVHLCDIVKSCQVDAQGSSMANMRSRFTGMRKDNTVRVYFQVQNFVDFTLGNKKIKIN